MLTGEQTPPTVAARSVQAIIFLASTSPLVVMGGAMVLVGLLALGPRKDLAQLWICLPAGLALLGIIAFAMYYNFVRLPALTVSRFALDEGELVLETPRYGSVTSPVADVRSVIDDRTGRAATGRQLRGWWLQLDHMGWVYLRRETPDAELLVSQLRPSLGGRPADEPGGWSGAVETSS